MLLTSGVLGGGTRADDFRLDLRVVHEAACGNHPRADEPQYPLWQGLPPGTRLTGALAARVDECTGIASPAAQCGREQRARLKTLLDVIHIPSARSSRTERGEKPTPSSVAARCAQVAAFHPQAGCRVVPGYRPAPLADRGAARVE